MPSFLGSKSMTLSFDLLELFRGPAIEDRIISAQLVGITGESLILVFAFLLYMPSSTDLALVLAPLTALAVAALIRTERLADARHV